jgi:WD40 repeat protein
MKNRILIIIILFFSSNLILGQDCKTYQQTHSVDYIDVSPNGKYIVSCDFNEENAVKLIDYETGKIVKQFTGQSHSLARVSFSPDGKFIVCGSWGGTIILWNVETGELVQKFKGHKKEIIFSVCFSSDGKYILSSSKDKTIKLWDINTGKEIRTFQYKKSKHIVYANFSPDNKYIIGGGVYKRKLNKGLLVWDVNSGELEYNFKFGEKGGGTACFSPDGKAVIGTDVVTNSIYMFKFPSGDLIQEFVGHEHWVYNFMFSPNMKYLFSCSHDKTIKIWDIETGQIKYTFNGHLESILSIDFSSDYKHLVSGSIDKTIKIWKIPDFINLLD